jgi:1,4-dihydroxy-2-naphthoate octaprenyltransferase
VLLVALPLGLITDGILHSNNTRDMHTDSRAGIKTMAMSLGVKSSAVLYGFEMLFPFVWIGVCSIAGFMPIATVIAFMTLPVAIACAQTMKNSVEGGLQMIADLDVRTANLQLFFSLLLTVAFVAARFL